MEPRHLLPGVGTSTVYMEQTTASSSWNNGEIHSVQ
jgi:hypothetical protein